MFEGSQHASTTLVVRLRTNQYGPARIIHRICTIPVNGVQQFWGSGSTRNPPLFFVFLFFCCCCLGTVDGTCPIGRLLNIEGRVTFSQCPCPCPFNIQELAPLGGSMCHLLLYPLLSLSISPSLVSLLHFMFINVQLLRGVATRVPRMVWPEQQKWPPGSSSS